MSNNETTKALPSHRVYAVSKQGDGKSTWTEIGAAWPHKKGEGFNLAFTARPLDGAQIVLLKARKPDVNSSRRTAGRYDELKAEHSAQ
jgi:hypothetical protein